MQVSEGADPQPPGELQWDGHRLTGDLAGEKQRSVVSETDHGALPDDLPLLSTPEVCRQRGDWALKASPDGRRIRLRQKGRLVDQPTSGPASQRGVIRLARLGACLAVAVVLIAQHHAVLCQHQHYLGGDNGFQNYPWHWWLAQHRHGGYYEPVPSMSLGYPLWAEPQVGLAYPLNTAFWPWLEPLFGYTLKLLLHVLLATVGMFLLARDQGLSRLGAAAAAIVFGNGGFLVHRLVHAPLLLALAWMPWVVYGFSRLTATRQPVWLLVTIGLAALQLLAGHPQMALPTAWLCLVVGVRHGAEPSVGRRLGWAGGSYAVVAIGALLLTATMWYAALRHTEYGPRTGAGGVGFLTQWSSNLPQTWVSLLPGLTVPWRVEKTGFAGTVAVIALCAALLSPSLRAYRSWAATALLGLWLSWGEGNPLYLLLARVPVINWFRGASRYVVLYAFAVALLVGALVDALGRGRRHHAAAVAAGLLLLVGIAQTRLAALPLAAAAVVVQLLAGVLYLGAEQLARKPERRHAARVGLVLVITVELLWFGRGVNPTMTAQQWLNNDENRVYAAVRELTRETPGAFVSWFDQLPSNATLLFGLSQPVGFTPLSLPNQAALNNVLHGHNPAAVLAAFGVVWIAARRADGLSEGLLPVRDVGPWTLFRNPLPAPRAYVPKDLLPNSEAGAREGLFRRGAAPLERALTTGPVEPPGFVPGVGGQVVSVPIDTPTRMVIVSESSCTHQVVAVRGWAPGWRVLVDGQPGEVLHANLILLSTLVPAGRHVVEFRYSTDHEAELQITQRAVLCWGVLLLGSLCYRRRPPRATTPTGSLPCTSDNSAC